MTRQGVPRWRRQRRPGGRGTVRAAEAGPARLAADGTGRGLASGRTPPLRAPRPGLSRAAAAAAPGDARAGPGLSLFNLGRRRARAPGSRAMALRELKVCLLGVSGGGPAGRAAGGRAGRGPNRAQVPSAPSPSLRAGLAPGPSLRPPGHPCPPCHRLLRVVLAGGPSPCSSLEPKDSSRPPGGKSRPCLSVASRLSGSQIVSYYGTGSKLAESSRVKPGAGLQVLQAAPLSFLVCLELPSLWDPPAPAPSLRVPLLGESSHRRTPKASWKLQLPVSSGQLCLFQSRFVRLMLSRLLCCFKD